MYFFNTRNYKCATDGELIMAFHFFALNEHKRTQSNKTNGINSARTIIHIQSVSFTVEL